jgi:hypothetical protein
MKKPPRGPRAFAAALLLSLMLSFSYAGASQLSDQNRFRASVRISGGAGFSLNGGGDLELERQAIVDYFADVAQLSGYSVSTNWKKMGVVPDFEVDFVFNLSDKFQLGVGSGYIRTTSKGDYGYDYEESGTVSWGTYTFTDSTAYNRNYVVSAIPIRLTAFYTLPLKNLNFYVYAGSAFYLASLKHTYTMDESFYYEDFSSQYLDEKYEVTAGADGTETSKANALGFHGGLGLEMKLGRMFGLGLEVFGRYASFGKWNGDLNETDTTRTRSYLEGLGWYDDQTQTDDYVESGSIWYYKYLDSDFGKKYSYMQTFTSEPAGDNVSDVRRAKINLNTIGIRLTLKFYFNLN